MDINFGSRISKGEIFLGTGNLYRNSIATIAFTQFLIMWYRNPSKVQFIPGYFAFATLASLGVGYLGANHFKHKLYESYTQVDESNMKSLAYYYHQKLKEEKK